MDDIGVVKLNETSLAVDCDYGQAMELWEAFSFYVDGYKYMPRFQDGSWDGKIRIFDQGSRTFPVGLFPELKKWSKKFGYNLTVAPSMYGVPGEKDKVDPREIMDFIETLDLRHDGKPTKIRDFQFNAVCRSIEEKRLILVSPTASGKSMILYVLLRWYLENFGKKVLIIVPRTQLVRQLYKDFFDYGWDDIADYVHKISEGAEKKTKLPVILSTWQSVYKMPAKWFQQYGTVMGDEVHGFTAKSLKGIMKKSTEAKYRWGLTGTLDGAMCNELVLQGMFGKVVKVATTKELQDRGILADLDIKVIKMLYPKHFRKMIGKLEYNDELAYITKYTKRTNFVKNLALDLKGNTLITFRYVDHGKAIYEAIKKGAAEGRKVFFIAGETPNDDREAIRKIVESLDDAIMVASIGVFSEGINIVNLHNIIFGSPSKGQIKVLQSLGRGLRVSKNGVATNLFDLVDDMHFGKRKNHTLKHGEIRIGIYVKQQFKYKVYEVELT